MLALLGQALPVVLVAVLLLNLLQRGLTRPGGTGAAEQPVPTLPEPAVPSSTTTPVNPAVPAPQQSVSHEVVPAEASEARGPADPPPPGAATVPAKPPPTPATAVAPIATDRTSPPADANAPSPPQNSTAMPASTPRSLAGGGSPPAPTGASGAAAQPVPTLPEPAVPSSTAAPLNPAVPAPPQAVSHEVVPAEASAAGAPTDARAPVHPTPPPPGTLAPCPPFVPAPGQRRTAPPESAVPSAVAALHAARRVATLIAAGVVLALWCAVLVLQRFQAPDWTAILLLPAAGGAVYALRARLGVFPLHCHRCGRRLPLGVTLGFDATATARYETAACPHPACGVQAPPPAPL